MEETLAAPNETPENSEKDKMNFSVRSDIAELDPKHVEEKTQVEREFFSTQPCSDLISQKYVSLPNLDICKTSRAAPGCQSHFLGMSTVPSDVLEFPEVMAFPEGTNPSKPLGGGSVTQNCAVTRRGHLSRDKKSVECQRKFLGVQWV